MPNLPIVVTVEDAKNPTLLVRLLRSLADKISELGLRLESVARSIKTPTFSQIRDSLQATGGHPLNVTGLRGVLSDAQPAAALRYTAAPTGLVLQGLKDSQFILVQNGSGYDLYNVIGGNPNTLFKLIAGAAGGNMMTTDTNQTPGATVVKTWTAAQVFNGGLTSAGNISVSAGQFDSASQFQCRIGRSGVQSIATATPTAMQFDTESFDIGDLHDNAVNNTRITVPTGGAGLWLVVGQVLFVPGAGNYRTAFIQGNGAASLARMDMPPVGGANNSTVMVVALTQASDADYFELIASQDSGGNLNTLPVMAAYKLS